MLFNWLALQHVKLSDIEYFIDLALGSPAIFHHHKPLGQNDPLPFLYYWSQIDTFGMYICSSNVIYLHVTNFLAYIWLLL